MSTTDSRRPEAPQHEPDADERLAGTPGWHAILRRPEVGAAVGALVDLHLLRHSRPTPSPSRRRQHVDLRRRRPFGIMAVAVALLMIGGEFDLSAGAMIGTTGLTTGILMTEYDINVWMAILASLAAGRWPSASLNGVLVMRTGLPSFIVTLGTFFVLQGVNLAVTKILIDQVSVIGLQDAPRLHRRPADLRLVRQDRPGWLPWVDRRETTLRCTPRRSGAIGGHCVATWVLLRTRAGNWIFAVGGAQQSARQVGVPVLEDQGRAVHDDRGRGLAGRHAEPVQDHDRAEHRPASARSSSSSSARSSVAAC